MSALDDLRDVAARVEIMLARQRDRLQRDINLQVERGWSTSDLAPEDMLDANGRPVLLDGLIALLNARAVLATHEPAIATLRRSR